jgi:hypothetical protein
MAQQPAFGDVAQDQRHAVFAAGHPRATRGFERAQFSARGAHAQVA